MLTSPLNPPIPQETDLATNAFPALPPLSLMTTVSCEVGELTSLGQTAQGERRYVPLTGGIVEGPELSGEILPGGVDWQWLRPDGVLEIGAHYVIRTGDGGLVEVTSEGLRHGPPEVMQRLARGEPVAASEYFFRTLMRFCTGAPNWLHLNRAMALAVGERQARLVRLAVYRIH